jgi:hypothetical protein
MLPEALNKALRDKGGPSLGTVNNPQGLGGKSNKKIDNFDNYQSYQSEETKQQQSVGGGGTSKDYTLARLERDNAALYERVCRCVTLCMIFWQESYRCSTQALAGV